MTHFREALTTGTSRAKIALTMRPGLALVTWSLALSVLATGIAWSDEKPTYAGRPLVEVLESLRARGLNLIYSTAVVDAKLVVAIEPKSADPRKILDEVLLPLGLEARDGPGDSALVVRASPPAPGRLPRYVEEIVVTPGRHSVVQVEQDSRRTVRSDDALLVPTIGGDVSRVVELLPGVAGADNSAAFNVRGTETQDVSFVLDGLELYEPFHLKSFQSPFSFLDSQIVDTIDFLAGGFTAELGDRHGGFVELSTAVPADPRRFRFEAGTLNTRASFATALTAGSLLVSGRAWYPEAFRNTMELGETGMEPRFGDAYLKYSMHVSPSTVVSAHSLLAYDSLEFSETEGAETVDSDNRSAYFWLRVLRSWSTDVSSETTVAAGRLERLRKGVSDPEDEPIVVSDERNVNFFSLRSDVAWQISDSRLLRGGFDVRPLNADYRYSTEDLNGTDALHLTPSGATLGAYVAYRTVLSERLAAEVGLRWDRQTYAPGSQISPRLNASWRLSDRSEVRLGLGSFFQSQRIYELAVEDGQTSFLEAELSRQVELTFQHRFTDTIQARFDVYARTLSRLHPRYENLFNPIELFPETEVDRVLVAPSGAKLRGVEALLQGDSSRAFHWWTSYAWSEALDEIDGRDVPRSWDQTHAGKFLVGYRWDPGWSVSLSGTVHTGWPTTPASGELTTLPDGTQSVVPVLGPRNSDRFETYSRLDLKTGRTFALARGRLRVDLEILNVTDRRNECCVDEFLFDVQPDGTIHARRESVYWLGITPSFSVLWEF